LRQLEEGYRRITVKVGASVIASENKLDFKILNFIVSQISSLMKEEREVILVTSGAIACGMSILGLKKRPTSLSDLQAAAAVGQNQLMKIYSELFKKEDIIVSQILLTWEDFDNRLRYLNAKETIFTLFRYKVIPIINENDTVSTDEIRFGDNDKLSALVANLTESDLLVILSDIDGLYDLKEKRYIDLVEEITPVIQSLTYRVKKDVSVGGMSTKIEAAKIATDSGIPCIITNGKKELYLLRAIKERKGTLFLPKKKRLLAKKRWIAFGSKSKGKIFVDDGAKEALLKGKSLLSVGVTDVSGKFERNDVVSILDSGFRDFGRGRVRFSSDKVRRIKGKKYPQEVIHRDNLVILNNSNSGR